MSRVTEDLSRGRPEAARAIWRDALGVPPSDSSPVTGRAALRALVLAVVAAVLFYFGWRIPSGVSATLALVTLVLGVFFRASFLAFEALLDRLSSVVGVALAWLLLGPFYFLVLTPLAWLTRSERRQKMSLRFRENHSSNWRVRNSTAANLDRPY